MAQFNSVCLCAFVLKTSDRQDDGRYYGCERSEVDFMERLKLLRSALVWMLQNKIPKVPPQTLVCFVLPEFFFRGGPRGYYIDKEPDPQNPQNTIYDIDALEEFTGWCMEDELLRDPFFKNWLFCFGTIPMASAKLMRSQKQYTPYFTTYAPSDPNATVFYKIDNTAVVFHNTDFVDDWSTEFLESEPLQIPPISTRSPLRFITKDSFSAGADLPHGFRGLARTETKAMRNYFRKTGQTYPSPMPLKDLQPYFSPPICKINAPGSHFFTFDNLNNIHNQPIMFSLDICQDARHMPPHSAPLTSKSQPEKPYTETPDGKKRFLEPQIELVTAAGLSAMNFQSRTMHNGVSLLVDGGPMIGSSVMYNRGTYDQSHLETQSEWFPEDVDDTKPVSDSSSHSDAPFQIYEFPIDFALGLLALYGPNHNAHLCVHRVYDLYLI